MPLKLDVSPSHVAVLVPSVARAAQYLRQFKFEIGEEEDFEETREIYVEGGKLNSLLLVEAKDSGSYNQALKKRGPGIHHLAIDVSDLEKFLNSLSGSGWLLHLNSLKTIKDLRTAYLAPPGFPALIEVQEKKKRSADGPLFVERVSLRLDPGPSKLIEAVGLEGILESSAKEPILIVQGKTIELTKLY